MNKITLDSIEKTFPCAVPQWDRSPRSGRRAVIYHDSSPELFQKHLTDILKAVERKPDEKKDSISKILE